MVVIGTAGRDDPEPLYVPGRSVVIVHTPAGCGFRRGGDPTPLYVRGHSDVNTKMWRRGVWIRRIVTDDSESEGVMYP
jgi:hypothetical protein